MVNYIVNPQGARVYLSRERNRTLPIPCVASTSERGLVKDVLSVGFMNFRGVATPGVTVRNGQGTTFYILPNDLSGWVSHCMETDLMLTQHGERLFPAQVEFCHFPDDRYTADIIT